DRPLLGGVVSAGGHQELPVRGPDDSTDAINLASASVVASLGPDMHSPLPIPKPEDAIPSPTNRNRPPASAKGNGRYARFQPSPEDSFLLPIPRVPDPHAPVIIARCQPLAIRRKRDAGHLLLPGKMFDCDHLPRRYIPHPDCFIPTR